MIHMMKYKGYEGSVPYSAEDKLLHGRILRIRDFVVYDGDSIPTTEQSFRGAVDEYLALCAAIGKKPNKPLKEIFELRTSRALHRRLVYYAEEHGLTTDMVINEALRQYLTLAE